MSELNVYEVLNRKRRGAPLEQREIELFIERYTRGEIPDYQMSALLMAIAINGMTAEEMATLTQSMLRSGDEWHLRSEYDFIADKHSTGGVGDKVSLVLSPWVAACGIKIGMLSGRGLGHTGGTLDKLEAIPGFNARLSREQFDQSIADSGCVISTSTEGIAPADKKIYALRDATSTVENIGLICASIMSKKLAEGIDALVLDVKTGSGAFMQREEDSVMLAEVMVDTAMRMGKKAVALITDMDQPLGKLAGHSSEVIESIEVLKGRGPKDLCDLSLELSAWMFYLGERTASLDDGRRLAETMIASGQALEKFRQGITLQGGDPRVIDDYGVLPAASHKLDVTAATSGYLAATNCMEFGIALAMLGGGRETKEDKIDHGVGLEFHRRIGDRVEKAEPLVTIHYNSAAKLEEAKARIASAFTFSEIKTAETKLIRRLVGV